MPLSSAFNAALTGLNNNALQLNIIGNNLANLNTTAFKASNASFAELLGGTNATSGDGNPMQVGLGTSVTSVSPVFSQGSIQSSARSTDAAINGNGFFVVSTSDGTAYSRAGNFGLTRAGELITGEGYNVLGYQAVDGVVGQNSVLAPITILMGSPLAPKATTEASIVGNLDSRAAVDGTFSSSVVVFDSLGAPHPLTFTFTKAGANSWNWAATMPATETGGAATAPAVSVGTGALAFTEKGILTSPTANPVLAVSGLASGAADLQIEFGILDSTGVSRLTGFAATSAVSSTNQDGYASAVLKDISFDVDGVVNGIYDNGQVQALGQLALANFANVEGLLKFKGSTFIASIASGEASIGTPGSGGRGTISGSALEQSNVDIAQEFTNLIIAQRGYQANSRIITTTDELYQDAINMKR